MLDNLQCWLKEKFDKAVLIKLAYLLATLKSLGGFFSNLFFNNTVFYVFIIITKD